MLTSQIVFQILLRDDSTESVGIALHSIKPSTYKNEKILLNKSWSISAKEKRKPPARTHICCRVRILSGIVLLAITSWADLLRG